MLDLSSYTERRTPFFNSVAIRIEVLFFIVSLLLSPSLSAQHEKTNASNPIAQEAPYDITQRAQFVERRLLKLSGHINDVSSDKDLLLPSFNYTIGIGFEQKLDTSWSAQIGLSYGKYFHNENLIQSNALRFDASVRYYYKNRKKVRRGEKANNLTGTYLSARTAWGYSKSKYTVFEEKRASTNHNLQVSLIWGYQTHLDQHWYFDLNYGLAFPIYNTNISPFSVPVSVQSNFAVGYSF